MLGLGGGMFLVPLLTIFLGLPIHVVVATSLLAVIVTSSVATATYCRADQTNVRLGFLLETFTVVGAVVGGLIATRATPGTLKVLFGVVALYAAYTLVVGHKGNEAEANMAEPTDRISRYWDVMGTCQSETGTEPETYRVQNLPAGLAVGFVAGNISALLGIGCGALKVPNMNLIMRVPLKAAVATSSFMVGITASATALIYYLNGYVDVSLAAPAIFGVVVGARAGALTSQKCNPANLRWLLGLVLAFMALQMIWAAF